MTCCISEHAARMQRDENVYLKINEIWHVHVLQILLDKSLTQITCHLGTREGILKHCCRYLSLCQEGFLQPF